MVGSPKASLILNGIKEETEVAEGRIPSFTDINIIFSKSRALVSRYPKDLDPG